MLDAVLRPYIDPPLNRLARVLARNGVSANHLTIAGMTAGVIAGTAVAAGFYTLGLGLIVVSRLCDGLDGPVARVHQATDVGGYLDIVADFVFYVGIPLGFAFADLENARAAAVLIASFTLTGVSFLAYATMAAKRDRETTAQGKKSFFYSNGLAEGTETIGMFVLMCLWPSAFVTLAWVYAAVCIATVIQRSLAACRDFR